jgi:aspartate kinase
MPLTPRRLSLPAQSVEDLRSGEPAANTVVLKFGGVAVATPQHFSRIAEIVASRRARYDRVVGVVSAMGDTTDRLLALAHEVNPTPPQRELDMLISVGERVSASLLAMALEGIGLPATSFTGSQAGILTTGDHTDAQILEVRPTRLESHLQAGEIVVIAGFQGVSGEGTPEITTLGRGGSDTTAVALAKALGAGHVEFFKDVDGCYTDDPKTNPQARRLPTLSYSHAAELVAHGASILSARCIEHARCEAIPLHMYSFNGNIDCPGSIIDGNGL